MSRALSLASCESFSPALLRSEPAALAAWIRFRLAKWLLVAPLRPSGWTYGTLGPTASHGSLHVGGTEGGKIALTRDGQNLELAYNFPGGGFELGMPIPHTLMQTLPAPKASTQLWLNEGEDVTGDGTQQNLGPLGVTRCCVLLDLSRMIDANVSQRGRGTAGCALLLGVRPELSANFAKLAMYSRRLADIVSNPISRRVTYVPGIRNEWTPIARLNEGGVDTRAIYEDVELIFAQYPFRSAIFFAAVQGTAHQRSVAYVGQITNRVEDDRGVLPPKGSVAKESVKFGLDQVGRSRQEIRDNLIGKGKELLENKIEGMVTNPIAKKLVDFGIENAGQNKKQLLESAIGTVGAKYPAAAAAAIAAVEHQSIRDIAMGAAKAELPAVERTVFNQAGQRLGLPPAATNFLQNNAQAIVNKDWNSIAANAVTGQIGGGSLGNQAAGVVLEKITGQPVTSHAIQALGAQGLKALLDKGPVVASGRAGDAAVTSATSTAVQVKNAAGSTQLSHAAFAAAYDTVATTGLG